MTRTAQNNQPIPWADLGAKATAHYSGSGLSVSTAQDGAVRVRCTFQQLDGEVTHEGLWLASTVDGAVANRFRAVADCIGRDGGPMVALPGRGVADCKPGLARYVRHGLVEEYSVSVDGVRQDFVVAEPPSAGGNLRVELTLNGARAEAATHGVRLVLEKSGRKLAYGRLRVVDAAQRELESRIEVVADHRLAVVVADAAAAYPVRIDPTFSDENWISLGGAPGANSWVVATVVDSNGNLYVGGYFTTIGAVVANYVAKWDGSGWLALGSGMDGGVYALAVSGTDLYAGGDFTTAGGVNANHIAKWDGSVWSALGSGMDGGVYALAVSGTDLYAGGDFTAAGGVNANYVAKWDGSVWSALGSGVDSSVFALAVSGTDLYAGGDFTSAGGVNANFIAKWDASVWSALGSGMDGGVYALAVSGTDLYAGGDFTTAGGVNANYVAKWDGSVWSALGSGMDGGVYALAVSGTDLYAGGDFTTAGGKVSAGAAKALISQQWPPGIISYWKFDEGSGVIAYDSVGANNGNIIAATWAPGVAGLALDLNGEAGVRVPDSSSLRPTNVTYAAWINPADFSSPNNHVIVFERDQNSYRASFIIAVDSAGHANLHLQNGSEALYAVSLTNVPLGTWTYLAGTYDGTTARLYLDGVEVASGVYSGGIDYGAGPRELVIGADFLGYPGFFHGLIDEAVIFDRALTPAEIQTYYQNGLNGLAYDEIPPTPVAPAIAGQPLGQTAYLDQTVSMSVIAMGTAPLIYQWQHNPDGTNASWLELVDNGRVSGANTATLTIANVQTGDAGSYRVVVTNGMGTAISDPATLTVQAVPADPSLVAAWSFDEGSGMVAYDMSGYGNDVMLYGATWVNGKSGTALNFNGLDNYAKTINNFETGFQQLTVELWALLHGPEQPPDYQALIAKTDGTGFPQDSVMILRNYTWPGSISANIQPGVDMTGYVYMGVPSVGVWHHLTVTMNGTTGEQKTYLDGNLVTTANKLTGPVNNQSRSLYFGRLGDWVGKYYSGLLDEVRFYSRVLSPEEVLARYQSGLTPTVPVITVDSRSGPWDKSVNTNFPYAHDTPQLPASVPVPPGETIFIGNATGTVDGGFQVLVGPDGYVNDPWGPQNDRMNTPGIHFPSNYASTNDYPIWIMALMGTFADTNGQIVGTPFKIGTQSLTLKVPSDASFLLMGVNDDIYTGSYGGNSGTFQVDVYVTNLPPTLPVITNQPQSQLARVGTEVAFTVMATGSEPLGYQWQYAEGEGTNWVWTDLTDGDRISGATTATLTIANVQTNDAGSYRVVMDNSAGSVASDPAALTVWMPTPIPGMVSYWKLEEGSGDIAYDSIGANNGNITAATWAPGQVGLALNLNGAAGVRVPDSDSLRPTNVTYAAWINPSDFSSPNNHVMVFERDLNYFRASFIIAVDSEGHANLHMQNGGEALYLVSPTNVLLGAWTYLVGTYDGTTAKLYLNGMEVASGDYSGGIDYGAGPRELVIGGDFIGYPGFFHGLIDEAVIFDRALTPSEIQTCYQNGLNGLDYEGLPAIPVAPVVVNQPEGSTVNVGGAVTITVSAVGTRPLEYQWQYTSDGSSPDATWQDLADGERISGATMATLRIANVELVDAGSYRVVVGNDVEMVTSDAATLTVQGGSMEPSLVAAWSFDEGTGLVAHDISGHGNDLRLEGASWGEGKSGMGLSFDGMGAYAKTIANFDSGFEELTVEVWAKLNGPAQNGSYQALIAKTDGSGYTADSVMLIRWADGSVGVNLQPDGDPTGYLTLGTPSVGEWHHFAVTMSGATGMQWTYLDGNLVTSFAKQPGPVNNQERSLYFGRLGDLAGFYYTGLLDEVRLYDRVLSPEEVLARYQAGLTPTAPVIMVNSLSGPWDKSVNPSFPYAHDDPIPQPPASVPVLPGQILFVGNAWGTADGGFGVLVGPDGYVNDPWGPQNDRQNTPGISFPSNYASTNDYPIWIMALMGTFADTNGQIVGTPFKIGTQSLILAVPSGAFMLLMGVNDDVYAGNSGSFRVNVYVTNLPSPLPVITIQPQSQVARVGTEVTFTAMATGSEPLGYQWQYAEGEGTNWVWTDLADGDRMNGATTATLTIANVQTNEAGSYRVVVSNVEGWALSLNATLTVFVPPAPGEPYQVITLNDTGSGSLPAAVEYANTNTGPDRIILRVAGTIHLQSPLVLGDTTGGTVIDGTTAPGYVGTPIVRLDGAPMATGSNCWAGVVITSASNTVRGLQICNCGNWVNGAGVVISGVGASDNVIVGSYIGNNGMEAFPNLRGIWISDAPNNRIGTDGDGVDDETERNVISGNSEVGVLITGVWASGNVVAGNSIGTDSSGSNPLGNSGAGVHIIDASINTIGGSTAIKGNRIAFNGNAGVVVEGGVNNPILSNALFANGGLGIDLAGDGLGTNDFGDIDVGANNLQNCPMLTLASVAGAYTVVRGSIDSATNTQFTLQLFSNDEVDSSGYGEGQQLLASGLIAMDASASDEFTVILPMTLADGEYVTATVTDPSGNTSEFSMALPVAVEDDDGDGVTGEMENGAPNGGDGNNDGLIDSEQVNVTSFVNFVQGDYVTLASPPGTMLTGVASIPHPSPADAPPDVQFPVGFFSYAVEGMNAGAPVVVTLYLPLGVTADGYYKYGLTSDNPTPHWYEFLFDGTSGAEVFPDRVVLHFVDGERGDNDLTANGTVVDPGGPALLLNQPPVLGEIIAPFDPTLIGSVVSASAGFTDANTAQTHTALWNWGDGSTSTGSVNENGGVGTVVGEHTYSLPGVYTVTLNISNGQSVSDQAIFRYIVIYDPNGGFVTGGGWINSPLGAYTMDPSLLGKATFGFVSKYQKGATVPTGNTQFNFHTAKMDFTSTSYQWLVIAGTKAQYKGSGTLNQSGNYGFMLTAIDGQIDGGGGTDKFRIKIWDIVTGMMVYDNQMDAAEDADPTTIIQGGNIVIHKQ